MYVDSDDSSLDDEIAKIRIETELILTQIRADADSLSLLSDNIRKLLDEDPMYARKDVFSEQIRNETLLTSDYIEKTKKLIRLRARYLELMKKRVTK